MMTDKERETLFETAGTVKAIYENTKDLNTLRQQTTRNTTMVTIHNVLLVTTFLVITGAWITSLFTAK